MDGVQLCKYAQWFLLSVNLRIVSTLFKTNEHLSTIILALLLFPFVLLCANNIFIFIGCKRQLFISDGGPPPQLDNGADCWQAQVCIITPA